MAPTAAGIITRFQVFWSDGSTSQHHERPDLAQGELIDSGRPGRIVAVRVQL